MKEKKGPHWKKGLQHLCSGDHNVNYIIPSYCVHTDLKPKSIFYVTHAKGSFIDTFFQLDLMILWIWSPHSMVKYQHCNLSPLERIALKTLNNNTNLVIKQACNGRGIVVLDISHYVTEANRLIKKTVSYRRLP